MAATSSSSAAAEIPSPKVSDIVGAIIEGQSAILHGPGGCGKSYCLRKVAVKLKQLGIKVVCTATTGVAAINLNVPNYQITSSTLHSWSGIGLGQDTKEKLLAKVMAKGPYRKRWNETKVLIIDEISMMGRELFEKLDYIGRHVRSRTTQVWGGLQLVVSGDFLQLPPVKDEWVFRSKAWQELNLRPFIFARSYRFDDPVYFQLLLRVRKGDHTTIDIRKLKARVIACHKMGKALERAEKKGEKLVLKPTILHSLKLDVQARNTKEMAKLPGKEVTYVSEDAYVEFNTRANYHYYMKLLDDTMPIIVEFKPGSQVMLKCNLDVGESLVNGSRGVVIALDSDGVLVRFVGGKIMKIKRHIWQIEDVNGSATRSQIPLILAFANTIHKAQGGTLDYAVANLGPSVFSPGQAYVALSRVRNLRGLFLSNFVPSAIKVDRTALAYVEELESHLSEEDESEEISSSEDSEGDIDLSDSDFSEDEEFISEFIPVGMRIARTVPTGYRIMYQEKSAPIWPTVEALIHGIIDGMIIPLDLERERSCTLARIKKKVSDVLDKEWSKGIGVEGICDNKDCSNPSTYQSAITLSSPIQLCDSCFQILSERKPDQLHQLQTTMETRIWHLLGFTQ